MDQFDVTNAFTQSDIDAEIYVEPPKGYYPDMDVVLKLKKSLYGTKQASRLWQQKLRGKLLEMGFKNCTSDPCLFAYHSKRGSCIVGCYVDDIICAYSNKAVLEWFKSQFIASDTNPSGFRAKHMGPLKWFLRVAVDQEPRFGIEHFAEPSRSHP